MAESVLSAQPAPARGITEQQLRRADLDATAYVCGIPLYPVGGTVFLYGPPGVGKSFIAQGLNHAITWAKPLGSFRVEHTANVLYCDFEGNAALVRERSLALTPHGSLAGDHEGGADMPTDTTYLFAQDWRGRTFAERVAELEDALMAKESAGIGHSLVVIDTFTAFTGAKPAEANAYEYDRECIEVLNQIAERYQVCILLIHHPNKAGEMSGSTGRAGTAWIVLRFVRTGEGEAVLEMMKCRVDRERSFAFTWDRDRIWRLATDIPAQLALAKGNGRALLALLLERGPLSKAQIIDATGMPEGSVKSGLQRLAARGEVELTEDRTWRTTLRPVQSMPMMPVHRPWHPCPQCASLQDPDYGCPNVQCPAHDAARFGTPASPGPAARVPAQRGGDSAPKWRRMARRGSADVELIEVDASYRMQDGERVYTVSPITKAVEIMMGDRDSGRLSPTWRADLPEGIRDAIDGQHHFGRIPQREHGRCLSQPPEPWVSYDVRGSFLAAYKTALAVKPLPKPEDSDGSEWTRASAGALEVMMPEWPLEVIGHPAGSHARPGQWQWIWSPTYRLLLKIADERPDVLERPAVRRAALRSGYQGASEAMLEGFYNRMKKAREHYTGEELAYVKLMYSAWLSTVRRGRAQVLKREDWWYSIRSEAFGRQWLAGWCALETVPRVIGMGNVDEIVLPPAPGLEDLFPAHDTRIGKLVVKDRGDGERTDAR